MTGMLIVATCIAIFGIAAPIAAITGKIRPSAPRRRGGPGSRRSQKSPGGEAWRRRGARALRMIREHDAASKRAPASQVPKLEMRAAFPSPRHR